MVFTEVDCIGSMINSSKTGEKGKGDDDAKTLANHKQLGILTHLRNFILLGSLVQTRSN